MVTRVVVACYDGRMGLVRWATVETAWLLVGLCLGCSASSVRPGDPTHPPPPDLERGRLELPEVQVPGPEVPPLAEEVTSVAQETLDDAAIEVRDVPRATSDKKRTCWCSPGDLLCAMSCAKPVSSPSATRSSAFDRGAASTQMSMAATIARSHCARSGGPVGGTRVTVQFATTGRVTSASIGSPYTNTETGSCVVKVFRQAIIPPFKGSPVSVSKSINISNER